MNSVSKKQNIMPTIILPNLNKDENKYKRTFGNKSLTEQMKEIFGIDDNNAGVTGPGKVIIVGGGAGTGLKELNHKSLYVAIEKVLDNSELIQMCENSFDDESVKQKCKVELINSIIKCLGI